MSSDNGAADENMTFDGSSWEQLARLVSACNLTFLQDEQTKPEDQAFGSQVKRSAYLAERYRGAALDWVWLAREADSRLFRTMDNLVNATREHFGISDEVISAQRRTSLEGLQWGNDLPVFFAEFDRLCHLLQLTSDATKLAILRTKLPGRVQTLLAEQALDPANYSVLRQRLMTMWALGAFGTTTVVHGSAGGKKRPRCGRCGKKGHVASSCHSKN